MTGYLFNLPPLFACHIHVYFLFVADGLSLSTLQLDMGPFTIDPTAYVSIFISISVGIQAFVFIMFSALADYGK